MKEAAKFWVAKRSELEPMQLEIQGLRTPKARNIYVIKSCHIRCVLPVARESQMKVGKHIKICLGLHQKLPNV